METISKLVVSFLLNGAWQITVIATAGVFCDARLRHRMPSRYRHVLWVVCLGASVCVPLATLCLQVYAGGSIAPLTQASGPSAADLSGTNGGMLYRFHARSRGVFFPANLLAVLVSSYAVFLIFRAAGFGRSYLRTVGIRKRAYPRTMPAKLSQVWQECSGKFSVPPIPVLCSSEVGSSATLGHRRPVVILPERFFADEIGEQESIAALAHELAHVRRRDFGINLLCEAASLPFCFHPAALYIKARMTQTRELACDEMAASMLPSATHYARSLVRLAQTMFAAAPAAKASYALGLFDTGALEERIMNILKTGEKRGKWARAQVLLAVSLVSVVSLAICGFSVRVADRASADAQRFVGTWETQYKGRAFFTLNLKDENGRLGGNCVHVTRVAWVDGALIPGTEETSQDQITEARISGNKVELRIGDSDPILLEFTLTGDNTAEGKPIVEESPDGPPPPKKPWRFQKVSANP